MKNQRLKAAARFAIRLTLAVTLSLTLTFLALGYASVNHVLHPPRIVPPGYTLVEKNVRFDQVDLLTQDGIRLTAWYTQPRNGAVILLAHGYGDNRPEWVYAMLAKSGYGVLAWDARAHGESGGDTSTIGYFEVLDVKAALKYALAQPGVEHVGAWGGSMGAATMLRAAAQFKQIEAVVADSSFASLDEEFDFLVPYPLINPMAKGFFSLQTSVNFDSDSPLQVIAEISPRPVYIIQGSADAVASPTSAQELFDAAQEPRYLWIKEGVAHLAMYLDNPRRYQKRVVGFFDKYLLGMQ